MKRKKPIYAVQKGMNRIMYLRVRSGGEFISIDIDCHKQTIREITNSRNENFELREYN